ncbi:hypothetical protein RB195_021888 [Necator americanus]|uniref:Reverse transcriptase domain-containing protein n=1 Tax=Necator americanus TaxID=51031 RepID=A0ABR1ED26_NECAM
MRCRGLEWDDMGVKVDGWYLHHLRFADDFVLITSSINQAERMLAEFDETCKIDLQPNLDDVCEERMGFHGCPIQAQRNEYIRTLQLFISRLGNQHDERPDLRAGQEETSGLGSIQKHRGFGEEDIRLHAHLFNTTILPALTYSLEKWAFRKQEENAISVMERGIEGVML